jgi:hypothetical protein
MLDMNMLDTSYPGFEDGTDRWFRNVGIQKSDAGDTPKRLLTSSTVLPAQSKAIVSAHKLRSVLF